MIALIGVQYVTNSFGKNQSQIRRVGLIDFVSCQLSFSAIGG